MSVVTAITLQMSCAENTIERAGQKDVVPIVDEINEWLRREGYRPLVSVEDYYGGTKHPQVLVYGGGYNGFRDEEFCAFVMSRPWQLAEDVILILKHEDDPIIIMRPPVIRVGRDTLAIIIKELQRQADRPQSGQLGWFDSTNPDSAVVDGRIDLTALANAIDARFEAPYTLWPSA